MEFRKKKSFKTIFERKTQKGKNRLQKALSKENLFDKQTDTLWLTQA